MQDLAVKLLHRLPCEGGPKRSRGDLTVEFWVGYRWSCGSFWGISGGVAALLSFALCIVLDYVRFWRWGVWYGYVVFVRAEKLSVHSVAEPLTCTTLSVGFLVVIILCRGAVIGRVIE